MATVDVVSVEVPLDQLAGEVRRWGFCYLLTVSEGDRTHLLALRPDVTVDDPVTLRFDAGGGRACRNATERPNVTLVFPPVAHSDGMSLVIDGTAVVGGAHVEVTPTWAVLHRAAP